MTISVQLYDYHVWANETIICRLKELPEEVYRREITSVFPTVSRALIHIYATDASWLRVLEGGSLHDAMPDAFRLQEELPAGSLEEAVELFAVLAGKYRAFLAKQDDMERRIVVEHPYAPTKSISLAEIIAHVATHGAYHRGNIAAMLRQLGHASVMQDFGLYWYEENNVTTGASADATASRPCTA